MRKTVTHPAIIRLRKASFAWCRSVSSDWFFWPEHRGAFVLPCICPISGASLTSLWFAHLSAYSCSKTTGRDIVLSRRIADNCSSSLRRKGPVLLAPKGVPRRTSAARKLRSDEPLQVAKCPRGKGWISTMSKSLTIFHR